ncbi:MAG: TIGR02587 family membrane protein [Actinomycetota bacterium]|nr:TIGR02587 family membrane protein [Actinomycetota bacterium]
MADEATDAEDVMRGVAGGAILGVPLLYTQETWLEGSSVSPAVILTGLVVVLGLNVALSYFVGFRRGRTQRPTEDAVVGMGLSILLAAILLVLLDRVGPGTSPENALGMIALLAIPVSVGFSIGAALAPQGGGVNSEEIQGGSGDLLVAAAGGLVFALNIAPTEEPVLLAAQLDGVRLGLLMAASLVLPYLMVFYAEFGGRDQRVASDGATQGPVTETLLAYAVAFAVSAAMLAMFGRLDAVDGATAAIVVTLAFPTSIGAALGRLLV